MIKLFIIGRRCAGKTREAALKHLRTVHGPLVYDAPADAGPMPAKYVQNHVVSPAEGVSYGDRDLVTEIWFSSFPDLGASTQTPFYKTMLQPDEPNFVDTRSVLRGVVRESGLHGSMPTDSSKLFVVLKRQGNIDPSSFEAACDGAIKTALTRGQVAGFVKNTMLPPPGGGEPFADQILEFWFATMAHAADFAAEPLNAMMKALRSLLDEALSFHVLADEYTVVRLRAASKQAA